MTGRALAACLLLAACAGGDPDARPEAAPPAPAADAPPAYRQGFDDGCTSGQSSAAGSGPRLRDATSFENDTAYARGWSDAFTRCGGKDTASAETVAPAEAAPRAATPIALPQTAHPVAPAPTLAIAPATASAPPADLPLDPLAGPVGEPGVILP
ncbi:hypothetical protein [Rhodobacteraceae bacterium DSL-40]|uniref:hypothetical protein n=1 Tax=Amaricoccus sp. B4 TaxID=3368557 RepID=UPI000DAE4EF5